MEAEYRPNYFELEEEEAADVDIGSFGPVYDDGSLGRTMLNVSGYGRIIGRLATAQAAPLIDETALAAMQHQLAQQAAYAQIPNEVKRVRKALNSWRLNCF
jgi:hypothetical protein